MNKEHPAEGWAQSLELLATMSEKKVRDAS